MTECWNRDTRWVLINKSSLETSLSALWKVPLGTWWSSEGSPEFTPLSLKYLYDSWHHKILDTIYSMESVIAVVINDIYHHIYTYRCVYSISTNCLVGIKYDVFQALNRGPKTSLILRTIVWHLFPVDIHLLNTLILFHCIFLVLFISILFLKKTLFGAGEISVHKSIRGRPRFS